MENKKLLCREEMKKIIGGQAYSCHCIGTKDTWASTYSSVAAINAAINASCSSGSGSCTAINQ